MSMKDEYDWLLEFLDLDDDSEPPPDGDGDIEAVVGEAASMLADLSEASGDITDAVVWQQVASKSLACAGHGHESDDEPGEEPEAGGRHDSGIWPTDLGRPDNYRRG